jgi:O-antigen/teichoic acid export membrane protein
VLAIGLPFYAGVAVAIPAEFVSLGLLSKSAGLDALGELRVTQALMSVAAMVPAALAAPLRSHLAASQIGRENSAPLVSQLKLSWGLSLAIVAGLAAIWPTAIDIVFGPGYAAAKTIGAWALIAFIPTMLASILTGALLVLKKSAFLLLAGVAQAAATITAAWELIPEFELAGFLAAQAIGATMALVVTATTLAVLLGRDFLHSWMAALLLATGGVMAVILYGSTHDLAIWQRLALSAGALCASVLPSWLVLSANERAQMRRAVHDLRSAVETCRSKPAMRPRSGPTER